MVWSHSRSGSRPRRLPKAEATELAPAAIGTRPSHSDYNPGALNRSPKRAFRCLGDRLLPVKLPSGGFGLKREDRRAALARRSELPFLQSSISFHSGGLGRLKNPSIHLLRPPALWSLRTGWLAFGRIASARAPHSAIAR